MDAAIQIIAQPRFDFEDDGTFTVSGNPNVGPQTGKWKLEDGKLILDFANPAPKDLQPILTPSADGSKIHFTQGSGSKQIEMDLVKG